MPARHPALRSFSRRRRAGFSLLEMSIVLAIMGALLSGGLLVGAGMIERGQYSATRDALDQAAQALNDFSITTGRLPCVASLNALPADPPTDPANINRRFGHEITPGNATCSTDTSVPDGTWRAVDGTRIVRIGALPTRTLGLPDSAGADGFGNRILYVVTEGLTSTTAFTTTNGAITVRDGSGNDIVNDTSTSLVGGAAFFLASAGADRKGGFGFKTRSAAILCGTSTNLDVENCNLSSTDITFRDALFNDGTEAARRFDDLTRWATKTSLGFVTTGGGSSLWGNTGDTIFSIGNDNTTTTGNVGIGTTTPSQNLHVTTPDVGFGNQTALQIGTGVGSLFLTHNAASISSNLRYDDGQWRLEAAGPGSVIGMSSASGDIVFGTVESGAAGAAVTSSERMRITNTGNVGIGTTTPAADARLDVAGAVKIGNTTPTTLACNATTNGIMRYNAGVMQFCNGTDWYSMSETIIEASVIGGNNNAWKCSGWVNCPTGTKVFNYGIRRHHAATGVGGPDNWGYCGNDPWTAVPTDSIRACAHMPINNPNNVCTIWASCR